MPQFLAAVLGIAVLAACSPASEDGARVPALGATDLAALRGGRTFNVVVITLDTTRADRLGAYGYEGAETPVIDSLAARGVLFEQAYSPVPLTLPAHASLFSGRYPFNHGVRDNGSFAVADEQTLMAETFRDRGYRTAAFVSSLVLDARWGLARGFDTYADNFGDGAQSAQIMSDVQKPANEIIDGALAWLDKPAAEPFLLWLHLYDPHAPYAPREPFASRHPGNPYDAEIAFMDSEIGRLIEHLETRGWDDDTFIVVAGDHGESLGEHGEQEHGFFVYEAATRVPLIFATPFDELQGAESTEIVSLVDVLPTVYEMTGIDAGHAHDGESLVPLFDGRPASGNRAVYSETYYPRFHYGWSQLTAVRDERYKLILSSDPELYDVVNDPAESTNLFSQRPRERERLQAVAATFVAGVDASAAENVEVDASTRRALESLGYLAGASSATTGVGERRPSPRARIHLFDKSLVARTLMSQGDLDGSARLYEEILAEDPAVPIALERLGEIYTSQRRFTDAEQIFRQVVALRPDSPDSYNKLGTALAALGRLDEAEATVRESFDFVEPVAQSHCLLGYVAELRTDFPVAVRHYNDCLRLDPGSSLATSHLATSHLQLGDLAAAERNARAALAAEPGVAEAHFVLGQIQMTRNQQQRAIDSYLSEIENTPDHVGAHFDLAMIHGEAGRGQEEQRYLARVLEIEPGHPRAALFMANLYLARGENLQRAVELATAAVENPLPKEDLAAGYFILANLHQALGNSELAREYLQKAESLRIP